MWEGILKIGLAAASPLVAYLAKILIESWVKETKVKLENAVVLGKFQDFTKAAMRAVTKIDFDYVQPLKKEGKFGPTEELIAKDKAMKLYKSYYANGGLVDMALFFECNAMQLEAIMQLKLEAAIYTYRHPHKKPGSIELNNDNITYPSLKGK